MKNRKFAALVLTTLALGTLAGCGKKDQPEQNQTQAEQSATESTDGQIRFPVGIERSTHIR